MREIDGIYTEHPYNGSRKMQRELLKKGFNINRKRIQRLMNKMGIQVFYPKPNLSKRALLHKIYPYLLKGINISKVNHVWSTDITYIPMRKGFLYFTAVIDWFSRYILTWRLSTSLEAQFCIEALKEALEKGKPEIFNTDQGCQFTSQEFLGVLENHAVKISMDGKGRAFDNIFIERFWRTLKYEEVYCKDYDSFEEAKTNLDEYLMYYNNNRLHQSLDYRTPKEIFFGSKVTQLVA
jgi:putative transposase